MTQPAITERIRQAVEQSIQILGKRVNQLGTVEPIIQRQGLDRILVQVPGLQDPQRSCRTLLGRPRKMEFRLVDTVDAADQAQQGRMPPESELAHGSASAEAPVVVERRVLVVGRGPDRRAARLRSSAPASRS